MPKLSLAA